jgi:hypothetical protein
MGIEQLDNLVKIGKLKAEPPEATGLDGMRLVDPFVRLRAC